MICRLPERPSMIPCHVRNSTSLEFCWQVRLMSAASPAPPGGGATDDAPEGRWPPPGDGPVELTVGVDALFWAEVHAPTRSSRAAAPETRRLTSQPRAGTEA